MTDDRLSADVEAALLSIPLETRLLLSVAILDDRAAAVAQARKEVPHETYERIRLLECRVARLRDAVSHVVGESFCEWTRARFKHDGTLIEELKPSPAALTWIQELLSVDDQLAVEGRALLAPAAREET